MRILKAHPGIALLILEKVDMLPILEVVSIRSSREESACPLAYCTTPSASLATVM
jgi:hypothetical protein